MLAPDSILLAPRGAGELPLALVGDERARLRGPELGLSTQLVWELRAWADRDRGTPWRELEFLVQAHLLAADLQVELGLGVTVYCLERDGDHIGRRSADARSADATWRMEPVSQRSKRFPRLGLTQDAFVAPEVLPVVEPDAEGLLDTRIRLMPEWGVVMPVWGTHIWFGPLESDELPLDSELDARLRAWNVAWESLYSWVLRDGPGEDSQDAERPYEERLAHVVQGHALAADLQAACGPAVFVVHPY